MKTEIIKIDIKNIDKYKIKKAAEILYKGGIVAFPTETVYGIGTNAFNEKAVRKIFKAKGRPSDRPLIVHIGSRGNIKDIVSDIPECYSILSEKFWPGPLTLVMKKTNKIPDIVTAGLDTVGVRMPSNPVAIALINYSGVPVAAPSANMSGKPSPTEGRHVVDDMYGRVDLIIDAGKVELGIDSTVLDITANPPVVLRKGGITCEMLSSVIGNIKVKNLYDTKKAHYSPAAELVIVEGNVDDTVNKIRELAGSFQITGKKAGIIATLQTQHLYDIGEVISAGDRNNPETIAANLFNVLREFDKRNVDIIISETFNETGIGQALMDRLRNASGHNIVNIDKAD